jgi:hypothetical protein
MRPLTPFFATNGPNCTAKSRLPWSSFGLMRSSVTRSSWRTIFGKPRKEVGDPEHIKVFASQDAAETWFAEIDPEGVAFEYEVLE